MTKLFTDTVFSPLAKRLGAIDVERTYGDAIEIAVDEGREILRRELRAEGAPAEMREAVHRLGVKDLVGAVGIPDNDPVSDDALEWEYGSMDGSTPPRRTFSDVSQEMADIAADEAAQRFTNQIVGAR